jgi:hypothetical protein
MSQLKVFYCVKAYEEISSFAECVGKISTLAASQSRKTDSGLPRMNSQRQADTPSDAHSERTFKRVNVPAGPRDNGAVTTTWRRR